MRPPCALPRAALLAALAGVAHGAEQVTVDNFLKAESHNYMGKYATKGALGKFAHLRAVTPVDTDPASAPKHGQDVIRMNRDTLYSMAVLDLASPASVAFPDVGGRFLSLAFISDSHDVFPSEYSPGKYVVTRNGCGCEPPCRTTASTGTVCTAFGTPYALLLLRTLADADNTSDIAEAHKAQDRFAIEQASAGRWDVPDWSHEDLVAIRQNLLELKATSKEPTTFGFFTGPERIDHLYGILNVAAGYGGVRAEDQTYTFWAPAGAPAESYTLTAPKVPLEGNGFWSITVYNKEGFMFADPSNYNSAAQGARGLNPDGSTTVFFGKCDDPARQTPSKAHCLPTQAGWNIVVRFFRPGREILDGSFVFPHPIPCLSDLDV